MLSGNGMLRIEFRVAEVVEAASATGFRTFYYGWRDAEDGQA